MDIDVYVDGKVYAKCYCCDSMLVIDFMDFHAQYGGDFDKWKGQKIKCSNCEYENEISDWDFWPF